MTTSSNPTCAAFILSHGRPDNVITFDSLRRSGWTRPVYVIIDNEDPTADRYRERFGADNVIEFDKAAIAETFDTADTQADRRSIVYARNASRQIAKDLGLDYHWQLDDDYTGFLYRYIDGPKLVGRTIRNLDQVLDAMIGLLESTGAATVAMSQGGDHIGGDVENVRRGLRRKAMNSFVLRTDRPVTFLGRINEDVNTYVLEGSRGHLFFTAMGLQLNQLQTQSNAGGMTDLYLDSGTYVKSFYTVMMAPSCITIRLMGRIDRRLHHRIHPHHSIPKIISGRHRRTT